MALNGIIRNVQRTVFLQEYTQLRTKGTLDRNNCLQKLAPYLDESSGIIKVGGRLNHSKLDPDAKKQTLMPKDHKFSELLSKHLHKRNMHAGPQTLVAIARQRYWVIDAKRLARKTVHSCICCFRSKPIITNQIMGNLPKERVTPARPFHTTGIDFCGPITIHYRQRGKTPTKAYVAVFVCFATKAVHQEVVSDLTTEAFLNALKRFIARRGLCATIYCDNATNFLGARAHLQELKDIFESKELQSSLSKLCSEYHIEWKPIPPRSPHFGGLWEAAVKSAKKHLLRQVGNADLSYEELHTVVVQIEAILNSRPLTPLSADPNDLEALTPGHFLTGSPLTSFAEPDISHKNINSLTRYKRIQHIQQNFWNRWSTEYLQELQTRYKWKSQKPNLQPGALVLIKESNLPPLKWPLGRVLETFDGADGFTRVVNVKTASGVYKRSIHNLCPVPEEIYQNEKKQDETSSELRVDDNPPSQTCLIGLKQIPKPSKENFSEEPPIKRKKPKRPYHPLRGKFSPINSNWTNSPNLHARHSRLSTSGNKKSNTRNLTASATIPLLMLSSLIMPSNTLSLQQPLEITPFTHHPGIFFEKLGQTQLINSEWSILTFYNLTNYWKELNGIQGCIERLETLCNSTILRKNHCVETLYQVQHEFRQIKEANEILHKSGGNSKLLRKRSPLDIVGNVANKLFGILDSSYAKFIEEEIEKTQANQNHLMKLLKNQASILEATANIIRRRDEEIQHQFEAIHNYMSAYDKYTKNVQEEQQAMHSFNALSTLTTLVIHNYHRIQDALLDVLTDAHHNKISPLLITPMQLRDQIALIKEHIPSTLTLPGSDKEASLFIYRLMSSGVKVTESYILYDIRIPLQLDEHFELFKLIPVPIPNNKNFVFIRPSTEYLIVSLSRERYYPLTQQELDKCNHMDEEHYLCNKNHPIFNLKANISQCEMDLLNHHHSLSPRCQLQTSSSFNTWIQLHTPNNWLYYLDHEETFNVVCGTTVMQTTLNGSGTLKLRPDCSVKQTSMTITGHGQYKSRLMSAFVPRINISDLFTNPLRNINQEYPNSIPKLHLQDIDILASKIRTLQEAEAFPRSITSHDIHHYSISYIIAASLICGLAYFLFCKWKRDRQQSTTTNHKKPPVPAERKLICTDEDFELQTISRGQDVQSSNDHF